MKFVQRDGGIGAGLFGSTLLDVAGTLDRQADAVGDVRQGHAGGLDFDDFLLIGRVHGGYIMASHNKCQWHPIMIFHNHSGMNIGHRIRQERDARGMSRAELSRRADIKYPTLAGIENGDQANSTRLHAIASALGVTVTWLETGKGQKEARPEPSQPLRIDADTIADAQTALTAIARIEGVAGPDISAWVADPHRLALAIDTVMAVKQSGARGDNIIDLMARIAQNIRQGEDNAVGTAGHGGSYPAAAAPVGKG